MKSARAISLQLVSFDSLQNPGEPNIENFKGLLFCNIGADTRAAAQQPVSHTAFRFLILGLHEDESSAHLLIDNNRELFPFINASNEIWSAVLQPFHHKGTANYLSQDNPSRLFDELASSPGTRTPIVVLTTAGFVKDDHLDMNRVIEFGVGTGAIRASMTAMDSLHSQQSFLFPGVIKHDFMSVTIWENAAAVGKFAYGSPTHKLLMEKHLSENMADRTSFTRCKIIRSYGTWYGTDPARFV